MASKWTDIHLVYEYWKQVDSINIANVLQRGIQNRGSSWFQGWLYHQLFTFVRETGLTLFPVSSFYLIKWLIFNPEDDVLEFKISVSTW